MLQGHVSCVCLFVCLFVASYLFLFLFVCGVGLLQASGP